MIQIFFHRQQLYQDKEKIEKSVMSKNVYMQLWIN